MFSREAIAQLLNDKQNFERIQKEAEDPESPNHLKAMLQFGLYKVYTTKIDEDLIDGFEKICEVALSGKAHTENAYAVMDFTEPPEVPLKLQLIFNHYNEMQEKSAHTHTILGLCHEKGIGTPINFKAAKQFYELAADQNYAPAQYNFGSYMPKDSAEQRTCFKAAADQGYAPAQNKLGVYYQVTLQNEKAARELYELAAAQGYAHAQNNLALYYEGIQENSRTVIQLYRLAATQGYQEAQRNLDCYLVKAEVSGEPLLTQYKTTNPHPARKGPVVVIDAPLEKKPIGCCRIL